jgi:hypothetical protein
MGQDDEAFANRSDKRSFFVRSPLASGMGGNVRSYSSAATALALLLQGYRGKIK